jgi:2-haloacid dehalogenase
VLSADQVKRLKPAPEPYRLVAAQFGVHIGDVRLIAAHAWDVAGALAAGCCAAFITRPGMVLSPLGAQPDIIARDIQDFANQVRERDR